MKSNVHILLLSLCGLLAYQLYDLTMSNGSENYSQVSDISSKPVAVENEVSDIVPVIGPIDQYTAMVQRPLFYDSRKPLVKKKKIVKQKPANTKKPTPREKPLNALLSAVILSGDKQFALLTDVKNKVTEKVYLGDTVLGWEMTGITPRTVTLTKGQETKVLVLEIVGSNGQPPSPSEHNNKTDTKQPAGGPEKPGAVPEK